MVERQTDGQFVRTPSVARALAALKMDTLTKLRDRIRESGRDISLSYLSLMLNGRRPVRADVAYAIHKATGIHMETVYEHMRGLRPPPSPGRS